MANVKVRLKDASNNVLHPETDWSVVLNKPSITVDQTSHLRETWHFGGYIDIDAVWGLTLKSSGDGNEIQVADKNTNNATTSLTNYPIKWSAISNKPNYIPTDERDIVFGSYSTIAGNVDGTGYSGGVYPAIRIIDYSSNPGGDTYRYTCYYFNGTSWTKFTDNSKFIPGI